MGKFDDYINVTAPLHSATVKGKLGNANEIFLEGDTQNVENEIKEINSRHEELNKKHDTLNNKHESLSITVQGIAATGGASTATNVTYNNDNSGLNAENAQDAIDELQSSKIDKTSIAQKIGEAEDKVMSQKAVSEIVIKKGTFATGDKINTGMFFDVSTLGTKLALNFNADKENYRIWLGFTNDSETDPLQYISGFAGDEMHSVNIDISVINKNNAKYLYAYVSQPRESLPSECKYTLTLYKYIGINDLNAQNIPFSSDILDLKDSNIANAIEKTYITKIQSDNINIAYTRKGVYITREGTTSDYSTYGISPVVEIKKGDIITGKIYAYAVTILAETNTDEYSETFNSLLIVDDNYADNGYDFAYTAERDMKIVFCSNMKNSSYYKIESIETIPDLAKKFNSDIHKSNVQIDNIKNRVEVLEQKNESVESRVETLEQKNESVESRVETLEQKNESVAQLNISSTALLATLCYGYDNLSNTRKKKYLCLSHITDVHGDHLRYKRWLDFTQDRKLIDGGFCTGDTNISTYNDNGFEACHTNQLSGITKPILVTIGNHDMGFRTNLYDNSNDNVGARFITPFISQMGAVQGGINKGYYYKDFNTYKIRVITLNEYEMPRVINDGGSAYKYDLWGRYLSQEQADWLCNALSSLEEGWSVILLTHQMLDGYTKADNVFNSKNFDTNGSGEHQVCQNGWIIQDILTAWLNRSSINKTYTPIEVSNDITGVEISDDNVPSVTVVKDFSASVGDFICAINGHTHKDGNGKSTINRNLTIITLTDGNGKDIFRYDDLYRNENDKSQDCFNVYGFDTDKRLIKIVRFGADMNNDFVERKYLKISY